MDGPSVTPSIPYDDPSAALAWLTDVLGFTVSDAFHGPDGTVAFAQLVWGDGVIFISRRPPPDNPWAWVGPCSISLVADGEAAVDRIHAQVVAAGGEVVREPHLSRTPLFPHGSYQLDVRDAEGNLWTVGTFRPNVSGTNRSPP